MKNNRAIAALAAIGLIVAAFTIVEQGSAGSQSRSPLLRGSGLELVDTAGRVRARISIESSGEVVFRLMDNTGTIRVKLGASQDGSGLVLLNDSTEVGIQLLANEKGSTLKLAENGRERVVVP